MRRREQRRMRGGRGGKEKGQKRRNVIANELCIVLAPRQGGGRWEANCCLAADRRRRSQVRIFEPPNVAAN